MPETGGSGGSGGVPARVFAGLRVLELGHYVAAPLVGQLLADQGADVLKVEPPGGDPYRRAPGRFVAWNRGKRSAVLDLRTAEGRRRRPRVGPHRRRRRRELPARRPRPPGVDLAELRADNPRLVTCSITGFGRSGPLRDAAGWEPIVHARAGLHVGFGEPDERVWRPFPLASVAAGLLATFGTIAALLERERSGLGQHVETSLLAAALYINGSSILQGDAPHMGTQGRTSIARVHVYPTTDGWLQVVAGTGPSLRAFEQLVDEEAAGLGRDAELPVTNEVRRAALARRGAGPRRHGDAVDRRVGARPGRARDPGRRVPARRGVVGAPAGAGIGAGRASGRRRRSAT